MNNVEFIKVGRDCDGYLIPSGDKIKLKKGSNVKITQSLGGDFTVYINGNLVKNHFELLKNDIGIIFQDKKNSLRTNDLTACVHISKEVNPDCYRMRINSNLT